MEPYAANFLGLQFLESRQDQPAQGVRIDGQLAPQHPARDGQRQADQVRLGFAAEPGAHLAEFFNGTRHSLDYRLELGGGAIPAGRFTFAQSRCMRLSDALFALPLDLRHAGGQV
jgi:hypothetical protein